VDTGKVFESRTPCSILKPEKHHPAIPPNVFSPAVKKENLPASGQSLMIQATKEKSVVSIVFCRYGLQQNWHGSCPLLTASGNT
jgi:hypothetical protein